MALKKGQLSRESVAVTTVGLLGVLGHSSRLNHEMLQHVVAGVAAADDVVQLSVACDEANVGGLSLPNSAFGLGDNRAIVPAHGWPGRVRRGRRGGCGPRRNSLWGSTTFLGVVVYRQILCFSHFSVYTIAP